MFITVSLDKLLMPLQMSFARMWCSNHIYIPSTKSKFYAGIQNSQMVMYKCSSLMEQSYETLFLHMHVCQKYWMILKPCMSIQSNFVYVVFIALNKGPCVLSCFLGSF